MKSWLEKTDIEMYSTRNEGKSVVAERFIKIWNNKIYKYMTSLLKKLYLNNLDDLPNKYHNTNHSIIEMKPFDVKSNIYFDCSKETNNKDLKFKLANIARISKSKNISAKVYTPSCFEEVFVIKKVKILCNGHMLLVILTERKFLEHSTKKNCKKQIKKSLELKK